MEKLIFIAGLIQLSILSASALVPFIMKHEDSLSGVKPMVKKMFWTYGLYTGGTILFLGLLSTVFPKDLLNGGPMKLILTFYVLFWGIRLILQCFIFDLSEYLTAWWMKLGNHLLTVAFILLTGIYGIALFMY